MQEVKKVISEDQRIVTDDNTVVTEHDQTVRTNVDTKVTAYNVIWYIYGLVAIVLLIRFVLRLTGANASNEFVNFVYSVSGVLSAPFDTIFGVTSASSGTVSSVFEPSILVAIAVYGLIAWGISKLLTLNEPQG